MTEKDIHYWNERLLDVCMRTPSDVDAAREALDNGAYVKHENEAGYNGLYYAVFVGGLELISLLLQRGADANNGGRKNNATPIYGPAGGGFFSVQILNLLFDYGADPNASWMLEDGGKQDYALHEAASKNNERGMCVLLEAGADPLLPDGHGKMAFDVVYNDNPRLQTILQKYMNMPRVNVRDGIRKADLFKMNGEGYCPLDNPVTWRQWPSISQALAENGEYVSKEELLQEGKEGRIIDVAVKARALKGVLEHLNSQGEKLAPEDLGELSHNPMVLQQLFSQANTMAVNKQELNQWIRHVPSELRTEIPNLQVVLAKASRAVTQVEKGLVL